MITETLSSPIQQQISARQIDLDFLFLDLNSCTRCVGTNQNLETAIAAVKQVLDLTNVELKVNKILIESAEQARAHRFIISPTIRLNGRDIALETKESQCDSCTDLCGCAEGTNCRVWVYQGQEYTEAPVAMMVEAILQEVYRTPQQTIMGSEGYGGLPENLHRFFAGKSQPATGAASACCSSLEQQSCCAPSAKASCCGEVAETSSCGCQ